MMRYFDENNKNKNKKKEEDEKINNKIIIKNNVCL